MLAVTHDQGEAFALADRVIVMRDGHIAQAGTPAEVWRRPADAFTARFLGFRNLAEATVDGRGADTPWGRVPVPEGTPPGRATLLIRPTGIALSGTKTGAAGPGLRCAVRARTFRGDHVVVLLAPERGPELEAACPPHRAPAEGATVRAVIDPAEVTTLPG